MIKMTCGNCGKVIEMREGIKIGLQCPVCGGNTVRFSTDVIRTCVMCGDSEEVKKGKTVTAYHDKPRCKSYAWILKEAKGDNEPKEPELSKVEPELEELEEPELVEEEVKPKPVRRRRRR